MAPIVFNNLFKGSFLATAANFVLLILCLYPVVGGVLLVYRLVILPIFES